MHVQRVVVVRCCTAYVLAKASISYSDMLSTILKFFYLVTCMIYRKLLEHDRRQCPLPLTNANSIECCRTELNRTKRSVSTQSESSATVSTVLRATEANERDHFNVITSVSSRDLMARKTLHLADEILETTPSVFKLLTVHNVHLSGLLWDSAQIPNLVSRD